METANSITDKETDGTGSEREPNSNSAILEVPTAKLQSELKQETEEINSMIKTSVPNLAHTDMVFPRTAFPCYENSPFHVSPVSDNSKRFRNNPLRSFNGDFTGKSIPGLAMKRARTDDVYVKPELAKKRCLDSVFHGKEEISEADFQMALIKRSISRKKEWVYSQVLQNLQLPTPCDTNRVNVINDSQRGGAENYQQNKTNTPFVNSIPSSSHQPSFSGLVRVKDSRKVLDEEGNCYIDTDDYMSFSRHKGPSSSKNVEHSRDYIFNEHIKQEIKDFDSCDTSTVSKRGLFLNVKINGGVAIDHDSMPKIAAIYTRALKGRQEHDTQLRRHVQAKITGSIYRPTISAELNTEEMKETKSNIIKEETKWWPPSPESMPTDVMSRDLGEGLLKVMTPDDMKAYDLPKKKEKNEARPDEEDDDVVVTKIKIAPSNKDTNNTKMEGMNEKMLDDHELPPLQLDANGKAANYKEILLHYISQKLKNDSQNTCLENISSVAERPRRNMSMEELCRKLKDTREKLEKEQLTWRRKLLSSLEAVLIKKIQRLEKESRKVVPDGTILEGVTIKKPEENTTEKKQGSVKGSNSDIVAMMEDLTSETANVESMWCKKRSERNSQSVSNIRGYESS